MRNGAAVVCRIARSAVGPMWFGRQRAVNAPLASARALATLRQRWVFPSWRWSRTSRWAGALPLKRATSPSVWSGIAVTVRPPLLALTAWAGGTISGAATPPAAGVWARAAAGASAKTAQARLVDTRAIIVFL